MTYEQSRRFGRRHWSATFAALLALVCALAIGGHMDQARAASVPTAEDASAGAGDTSHGDDNVAVAVNTTDGKQVYAVRLKIVQTGKDVVDPLNAAVAAASCHDCTTVAIAIEGVLVYSDNLHTFTPVNLAIALNTDCDNCQTLAAAYQTVTQHDTRVRITGDGRRQIAELRRDLQTLRTQDLDIYGILAEADRIAAEFFRVLQEETLPVGPSPTLPGPVTELPRDGRDAGVSTQEVAPAKYTPHPSSAGQGKSAQTGSRETSPTDSLHGSGASAPEQSDEQDEAEEPRSSTTEAPASRQDSATTEEPTTATDHLRNDDEHSPGTESEEPEESTPATDAEGSGENEETEPDSSTTDAPASSEDSATTEEPTTTATEDLQADDQQSPGTESGEPEESTASTSPEQSP